MYHFAADEPDFLGRDRSLNAQFLRVTLVKFTKTGFQVYPPIELFHTLLC